MKIRIKFGKVHYVMVKRSYTEYRAYFARWWQLPHALWRVGRFAHVLGGRS